MADPFRRATQKMVDRIEKDPFVGAWRAVAIITAAVTIAGGVLVRITDPDNFGSVWDGLWWSIQTVTTVGYGDSVPTTLAGRLVAALVMIGGIGFITVTTAAVASAFVEAARQRRSVPDDAVEDEIASLRAEIATLDGRDPAAAGGHRRGAAAMTTAPAYDQSTAWKPGRPRIRPARLVVSWVLSALTLIVVSWILPGLTIKGFFGALLAAAVIAVLNALLPPIVAGLRLPYTVGLSFVLILILDALLLMLAAEIAPDALSVDNFWWALLAALVMSAVGMILAVATGTNEDDTYTLRLAQRIAKRTGGAVHTDVPGIIFLEIDGLALPILRRAMRDGNAPQMARWLADDTHRLVQWETDLSSQTGASQAGILLGSNDDIPAFRWVEKETGRLMTCSAPADCAEIERRRGTGDGLLVDGGASRGNLLSGEADEVILTVSRMDADKEANPGYRAFFANGMNVTRVLVLYVWEVDPGVDRLDPGHPPRRAPARPPRRQLPLPAGRDVRGGARPGDLRRAQRHDEGAAGGVRDLRLLRRGGPPLGPRARGHAGGAAQAGPAVRARRCARAATRRAPTRWWCCRTTARPRAPPSCSATATASRTWWSARSAPATSPSSRRATRTTPRWARPCARRPARRPRTRTPARTSAARTRSCSAPATSASCT